MNEGTRSGKSTIRLLGISAERPTNGLYLLPLSLLFYSLLDFSFFFSLTVQNMVGDILKQIFKGLQKLRLLFLMSKADTLLSVVHQRSQRQGKTVTYPCRAENLLSVLSVVMLKALPMLMTDYIYVSCMNLRING
jgi:hypothetical protein